MTTDRQKYAVNWVNNILSSRMIVVPKFKKFDGDIEDFKQVSEFLGKWLNYAKSIQYEVIAAEQEYQDWLLHCDE